MQRHSVIWRDNPKRIDNGNRAVKGVWEDLKNLAKIKEAKKDSVEKTKPTSFLGNLLR